MTLSSVNTHLGRHSLQMYLQERVKYSESLGRFSDWINTSSALASRAWQLSRRSLTSRAFAMRIIWDKGYHGGNRSKGAAYTQAQKDCLERCTVCAGVDSANHWIRECPNPVMVHSREASLQQRYQDIHCRRSVQESGGSVNQGSSIGTRRSGWTSHLDCQLAVQVSASTIALFNCCLYCYITVSYA